MKLNKKMELLKQFLNEEEYAELVELKNDAQIFNGLIKAGYNMSTIGRNQICWERIQKQLEELKMYPLSEFKTSVVIRKVLEKIIRKCNSNFHDPDIRKQYTKTERCSVCEEL